jgi:hypothetical protein
MFESGTRGNFNLSCFIHSFIHSFIFEARSPMLSTLTDLKLEILLLQPLECLGLQVQVTIPSCKGKF